MADSDDESFSPVEDKNPLYTLSHETGSREESLDDEQHIFVDNNVKHETAPDTRIKSPSHTPPPMKKMTKTKLPVEKKGQPASDAVPACPRINCPEKIVICLDFSPELCVPSFRSRAGEKFTAQQLLARALGLFVWGKHALNSKHQFAIVILGDEALWVVDFTSDPSVIARELENMEQHMADGVETAKCDLSSIFDIIHDRVELPHLDNPSVQNPPFVVRILLLYGRSKCVPTMSNKETQMMLYASPHFFVDVLYVHEHPSDDNLCEEIYDRICELDRNGLSYIYEVSRNPTKLYDNMAKLLGHPLQRPPWSRTHYNIEPPDDIQVPSMPTPSPSSPMT